MKENSIKFLIQENDVTYFAWWTICRDFTVSKILKKYIGSAYKNQLMIFENGDAKWGTDLAAWHLYGEKLLKSIESGTFPLKQFTHEHLLYGKKIIKICRDLEKANLTILNSHRLAALFKTATANYIKLNELGFVAVVSDLEHSILSNELKSIIEKKNVKPNKVQSYLNALMMDERKTLSWQEYNDLLHLTIKMPDLKALKQSKDFSKHIQKYNWVNFGYKGPSWKESDFIDRIKKLRKENTNLTAALQEHNHFLAQIKSQRQKIEKLLNLSPREKNLFTTARAFSYLKSYRVDVRHYFCYVSYKIFQELSYRFKLPVTWFEYATEQETQSLLAGKKPNPNTVFARQDFYAELKEGDVFIELNKAQAGVLLKKVLVNEKFSDTDTLTGQAAFLGKVRGKAKIITNPKEIGKVNKGDILIAVYTDPNLLPAMEKAAAFVTDQGGITSHAAITAREMKKPCIIGTKIATKIFKDGDLVEVDANNGTVKKIK